MPTTIERVIGREKLIIESGKLAGQAHGSVTVQMGETIVLVTAVMADKPRAADMDFLPLTVDFEERLYAAGKIPGSFFRREGRPGQEATLSCRLIDRSIRPLFPKGMFNDIQVTITVLSADPENPPEILAMVGASAALSMSQIPFEGPIGASRLAYANGEYIVNPTYQESTDSQLSMVVSSTPEAILMVEAGADEVSEEIILEAIRRAHAANLETIDMIEELVSQVGKAKLEVVTDTAAAEQLEAKITSIINGRLSDLLEGNPDKTSLESEENRLKDEVTESLSEEYSAQKIGEGFKNVMKFEVRRRILEQGLRPDGRTLAEIRPITCEVGLLPRTHGSGLFTRGMTQVLSIVTLASMSMKQTLDTVGPVGTKRFMHHYNFPSFSTGEARRVGSPGRREIGHGALAERAILPALPSEEDFPYAIRVVSEVLSSNGSTSMGSVCGASLALMNAGVPVKQAVAGIAMGLVTGDDGKYAVLSDIQGVEDFLGDMDFKVAGTAAGVNALQMDIKLKGLNQEILSQALEQARVGRLHILDKMNEAISSPSTEMSAHAPKMIRLKIPVDKIGALIGPGGRIIRGIIEETGCSIDVQDDGSVTVGGSDAAMLDLARSKVDALTRELAVGDIFTGKIVRLTSFGVFVELVPGRDGLVRSGDLGDLESEVEIGQEITVMIQEIDSQGRLNLSRRALFGDNGGQQGEGSRPPAPQGNFDRGRRPGGFSGGRGGSGDRGRRPGGGPRPGGPRPDAPRQEGMGGRFQGGSGPRGS
ncbi:MAG: polyribonucleotide nucleotidyltransferase [Chloroflexi bacterium]|nr:polyribonucleotide nucleotidyltransferase [Chloroflexota bacterium]MCI0781363.1 polyribonucleotide nucleotidyltransferase [Chloroflexota bacterium]MCI0798940.1 polyribonucleotide nucleotidyltransferase [Chloroflexota bacterium]MCI0824934.1 polyribonucleotide nucleotidyltransferase [Chloroflexota bacterium]